MGPLEEFVRDAPIWREMDAEEERPNVIGLPTSYLHHSAPIKLTIEFKLLAKAIEPRQLMGLIPWALDNAIVPSLVSSIAAKDIMPLTELAKAMVAPITPIRPIPPVGMINEWAWASETSYSVEMARPIEIPRTEEAVDLLKVLPSLPTPALSDKLQISGQEWIDLLAINQPWGAIEGPTPGGPLRLLFKQLAEAARQEAEEIRAALAQFQEGLERLALAFGPPQAAPILTKGAIRARGTVTGPGPKEALTIEAAILTEAWEAEEELGLKVERGPQICRGKLDLSLIAPLELVGRTANIILSMEGMEVLLDSVAIESAGREKARIELGVDLESVGIKIEDSLLPLEAFKVLIEPSRGSRGRRNKCPISLG